MQASSKRERGKRLPIGRMCMIMLALLIMVCFAFWAAGRAEETRRLQLAERTELLRALLQQYRRDRGEFPPSLQALVSARYLRQLPRHPYDHRHDAWQVILAEENGRQVVIDMNDGARDSTWALTDRR